MTYTNYYWDKNGNIVWIKQFETCIRQEVRAMITGLAVKPSLMRTLTLRSNNYGRTRKSMERSNESNIQQRNTSSNSNTSRQQQILIISPDNIS